MKLKHGCAFSTPHTTVVLGVLKFNSSNSWIINTSCWKFIEIEIKKLKCPKLVNFSMVNYEYRFGFGPRCWIHNQKIKLKSKRAKAKMAIYGYRHRRWGGVGWVTGWWLVKWNALKIALLAVILVTFFFGILRFNQNFDEYDWRKVKIHVCHWSFFDNVFEKNCFEIGVWTSDPSDLGCYKDCHFNVVSSNQSQD